MPVAGGQEDVVHGPGDLHKIDACSTGGQAIHMGSFSKWGTHATLRPH